MNFFVFFNKLYYNNKCILWGDNMNFSYDGADTSKLIKRYKKDGNNYTIEYLNGDISTFYSTGDNDEQNIMNTMIEQIIERQDKIDIISINNLKHLGVCTSLFSAVMLYANIIHENRELLLPILGLISGIIISKNESKKIKELKKYKLFLEMTKDNPMRKVDDEWLDYIEFDKLYQIPLNVNTVDDYSYSDIKLLSKKMKEKNDIYKK